MTILVTGGAGFIGSNFVLDWVRQVGEPVINLDVLTYAGNVKNLEMIEGSNLYRFVRGSIGDGALVGELLREHGVRAVVHFAAESHVDRSISGPAPFFETNVMGTLALLEAAKGYWNGLGGAAKEAFRFLHVSTDEVYGTLAADEAPFAETNAYKPNSPYAASKASSDHIVRAYHETFGLPILITNCSNNYGPYQFPEKLIPLVIHNALEGQGASDLRRRAAGARLAVCRGPLLGDPAGARSGRTGRDLQCRRRQPEDQYRGGQPHLRAARQEAAQGRWLVLCQPDHPRSGPAGA